MRIFRISKTIGNYFVSDDNFPILFRDFTNNLRNGIRDPKLEDMIRFPFEPDFSNLIIGRHSTERYLQKFVLMRSMNNPETGKPYTNDEAFTKAQKMYMDPKANYAGAAKDEIKKILDNAWPQDMTLKTLWMKTNKNGIMPAVYLTDGNWVGIIGRKSGVDKLVTFYPVDSSEGSSDPIVTQACTGPVWSWS
jgi:hypothetical protein